jgi:hypothetical protein
MPIDKNNIIQYHKNMIERFIKVYQVIQSNVLLYIFLKMIERFIKVCHLGAVNDKTSYN